MRLGHTYMDCFWIEKSRSISWISITNNVFEFVHAFEGLCTLTNSRDWTENILTEWEMLMAKVVQVNVAQEGQGNAVEPEGEVESAGSVMT